MKNVYVFECYEPGDGTFRFRYKGPNGKTMFPSHPYDSKAARSRGIVAIKQGMRTAVVTNV